MRYVGPFFAATASSRFSKGARAQLLCAVATFAMGSVAAHADVIRLQVLGSVSPDSASESCASSTGCILTGNIRINNLTGAVISADVIAIGFSPSVGPFTDPSAPHISAGLTDLEIATAPVFTSEVALVFSTPRLGSLVGYTGGPLSTVTGVVDKTGDHMWNLTVGFLTETTAFAPIPEPSTWAMMLIGLGGLGLVGYRQTRKGQAASA